MRHEAFEIGLDIRTMYALVDLRFRRDEQRFMPEELLVSYFFEPLEDSTLMSYNVAIADGQIKDIFRGGPSNSEEENESILARVEDIRSSFRYSTEAVEAGDLVDFDQLEDQFPWLSFLTRLLQWSRLRLSEIEETLRQQGGIDGVTFALQQSRAGNLSGSEIETDPPSMEPRQLLPAADIEEDTAEADAPK